ncbi:flagellar biosynthetic protein FliO [Exiguobacterium sp.]|uniref:flagellar biosynthetic protein FliO n=1 Tax=Exiguobacterium sp. TaxID=44751 RepID=UPI00263BAEA7|nr:flagellar biosynthetic protein FliO [Exiguobacterium sp.]MCC5892262.1 flagellar biosynthetic protein FliO [Exiguobacterium sp.]
MSKWWLIILLVVGLTGPATVEAATVEKQFEQQQEQSDVEKAAPAAVSGVWTVIKIILSLVVVIGGFLVLMRWLSARTQGVKTAQHMKHLGGVPLGKDRSVQLVKLGDQVYVLGVGESIQLIDRVEADVVEDERSDAPPLTGSNGSVFLDTFKQQLSQIEQARKKQ